MSLIRPFRALRPAKNHASRVASVPYDVLNREEAWKLGRPNPLSFLHVSRSEIDLSETMDPYSDRVYEQASKNFNSIIQECPFLKEDIPSLYLYRLQMGDHVQTGIAGTFSIDEYDSDRIKKHERTRPDKEDDRTRHIQELSAQTGPVFLTYPRVLDVDAEVERIQKLPPLYDFTSEDGIAHTLWVAPHPEVLVDLFSRQVSTLYIADGHHRAAAASRARNEYFKRNKRHQGTEDYNYFLAVAFPDNQLKILPYHRVVKDLLGMKASEFFEKLVPLFQIAPALSKLPPAGELRMYIQGQWYSLCLRNRTQASELDVSVLQDFLLNPVLGIKDPRTDQRIQFVGGIRGTSELEKLVDSGHYSVAFSLHPTRLSDLMKISDQGKIMPPKSTWFEPKLRDGLLVHQLEDFR